MVLYIIQLFLVLTRCLGFISRFTVDFSERFTPAGYRGEEVWVRTFFHLISVIIQQRYPYPVSRKKDTIGTFFHLISVIIQQRYPYPVSRKKDTIGTFFHLISVIIQQRYPYPVSRKKDTNILPIQCNYSTIGDFSNTHVFKFTFTYTGNNLIQMFCSCGCIAF